AMRLGGVLLGRLLGVRMTACVVPKLENGVYLCRFADHLGNVDRGKQIMKHVCRTAMMAAGALVGGSTTWADTLPTHRIPAALAVEAASETVAACAKQRYHETAVVLDADGNT